MASLINPRKLPYHRDLIEVMADVEIYTDLLGILHDMTYDENFTLKSLYQSICSVTEVVRVRIAETAVRNPEEFDKPKYVHISDHPEFDKTWDAYAEKRELMLSRMEQCGLDDVQPILHQLLKAHTQLVLLELDMLNPAKQRDIYL